MRVTNSTAGRDQPTRQQGTTSPGSKRSEARQRGWVIGSRHHHESIARRPGPHFDSSSLANVRAEWSPAAGSPAARATVPSGARVGRTLLGQELRCFNAL
ncbi:hypothetical protein MTO96_002601 [Rhipicephalus appendiculatus]